MEKTEEGYAASKPIPFDSLTRPSVELSELLEQHGMSSFDAQHVLRPLVDIMDDQAPVRTIRFADGVSFDWAYRLALSEADEGGALIGQLNGSPALFSSVFEYDQLLHLYNELKHLYDNDRNTPKLTNDIYPGAKSFCERKAREWAKNLPRPARVLDLASAGAGAAPYFFESLPGQNYAKVDDDTIALAVLGDEARKKKLKFVGLYDAVERVGKKGFRVRASQRLKGDPNALVCTHVLNQLGDLFRKLTIEDWLGSLQNLLDPGGRLFIADFYYPDEASDEAVIACRSALMGRVDDHPDLRPEDFHFSQREECIPPEDVQEVLADAGFKDFRITSEPSLEGHVQKFYVLEAVRA